MKRLLISLLNGALMVILNIIYLNSSWIVPVEEEMMVAFTKYETHYCPSDNAIDNDIKNNTLFINTANAMALTEINDEKGEGNIPITDRAKLAAFFSFLARKNNSQKYLLCDIRFDDISPDDSLLIRSIASLKNFVFPAHINKDSCKLYESKIEVKQKGIADYITYEALFSKMMLDNGKYGESLPLKMYEDINLKNKEDVQRYHHNWRGLWLNGSWMPNSLFPRFYAVPDTVKKYAVSLNSVLKMAQFDSADFYNDMIKGKMIVVGDFQNDVQPTAIGRMPGTLILLNSYFTLKNHGSHHYRLYILFLFISFSSLSYYFFYYQRLKEKYTAKKYSRVVRIFFKHMRLFGLLVAISLISFCFGTRCSVLGFLLYFFVLETIIKIFVSIKKTVL